MGSKMIGIFMRLKSLLSLMKILINFTSMFNYINVQLHHFYINVYSTISLSIFRTFEIKIAFDRSYLLVPSSIGLAHIHCQQNNL